LERFFIPQQTFESVFQLAIALVLIGETHQGFVFGDRAGPDPFADMANDRVSPSKVLRNSTDFGLPPVLQRFDRLTSALDPSIWSTVLSAVIKQIGERQPNGS
jgi:hypothetical protein